MVSSADEFKSQIVCVFTEAVTIDFILKIADTVVPVVIGWRLWATGFAAMAVDISDFCLNKGESEPSSLLVYEFVY